MKEVIVDSATRAGIGGGGYIAVSELGQAGPDPVTQYIQIGVGVTTALGTIWPILKALFSLFKKKQ